MSQIWDIYCKHCLWSIFGPCWCTKSCKTTFYVHLSRIWKLARFKRFIRKVFATKILLSGKFSLFATLFGWNQPLGIPSLHLELHHSSIEWNVEVLFIKGVFCDSLKLALKLPNKTYLPSSETGQETDTETEIIYVRKFFVLTGTLSLPVHKQHVGKTRFVLYFWW